MRVLLSTTSGAGHFRPLLPLARALERAGHELACAAPLEARAMVEREGLRHLPFDGVPPDHPDRLDVLARVPTLPSMEAEQLFGSVIFGRLNTTFALPGAQSAIGDYRPDLVVHEAAELSVRLAAAVSSIPGIAVNPSLTIRPYAAAMARGIADLRESLGLDRDEDGRAMLTGTAVSWFPASFDVPEAAAYDVRRYRGPGDHDSVSRDLVYVTLGSEAPSLPFFGDVLRALVGGAARAGHPVLVATGRPVDPGLLADVDGDVRVESWVDQDEVLNRARVVVCHGGAGTTLGALNAAVPVVAVPLFADQHYNADRLAATDTGRRLSLGPSLADDVAAAVRDLAASPPAGCARVAAEIAALPVVDEAVPWLESLA